MSVIPAKVGHHVGYPTVAGIQKCKMLHGFWILDASIRESRSDPINRPAYRQTGLGNDRS